MYRVVFTKQVDKVLRKMPRNQMQLIREKLNQLAEDPYAPNNNVTKLQNRPGYRLRIGNWRVIYELLDEQLVIVVLKVGPRGSVYR